MVKSTLAISKLRPPRGVQPDALNLIDAFPRGFRFHRVSHQIQSGGAAQVEGIVMTDGDPVVAQLRMIDLGAIAGGINPIETRVQVFVHKDAAIQPKSGACRNRTSG